MFPLVHLQSGSICPDSLAHFTPYFSFAIQLSYLRYPGYAMASDAKPLDTLLAYVSQELQIKPSAWNEYGQHDETRHEHAIEL